MDISTHRKLADQITDDMLTTPVKDLDDWQVDVLQLVLRGPFADEIMERMDNL